MAWYIDPNINDGYPWQSDWPQQAQTSWSGELPYSAWRIQADINDNYPWIWWWFREDSSRSGEMLIGGSQTNYPRGFSSADRGGIRDQFNRRSMWSSGNGAALVNDAVNTALAGRQYAITGYDLQQIINKLNVTVRDATFETKLQLINSVYGANVYDGILCCKAYPFNISLSSAAKTAPVMYGLINLAYGEGEQGGLFSAPSDAVQILDMGQITLDISQAWEIESIDYSIYLPFCGVYPIDIRSGVTIEVKAYVDLYHGAGEYHILQDGQWTASYKFNIGTDIPINLTQGITNSNMVSNIASVISDGLPLALGAAGMAIGGTMGGMIGNGAGSLLNSAIDKAYSMHQQISAPQIGGLASLYCYPYARIIAKIPKMFKGGYGYSEILGESRQCSYQQLSSCSGFTKCNNYKCDIIVATDQEKAEIERLMTAGVFI